MREGGKGGRRGKKIDGAHPLGMTHTHTKTTKKKTHEKNVKHVRISYIVANFKITFVSFFPSHGSSTV